MADEKIVTRGEERCFFELFYQVLEILKEGNATDEEIYLGIEKIVTYFRVSGPGGACETHNFSTRGDLLCYFYWSSPLSAGVTRMKALYALQGCDEFSSCFNLPSLKIVSIGGGTGSDLVGLYSAAYENSEFQHMDVTIVDINIKWKPFFSKLNEILHVEDFGNACLLAQSREITTSYICADMKRPLSDDLRIKLKNANIIWMKGVQSILAGVERRAIVGNVISSMSTGALLVVFDSPFYDNFDSMSSQLERIFTTEKDSYYLAPFPDLMHRPRFCTSTNQEISIFTKVTGHVASNYQKS